MPAQPDPKRESRFQRFCARLGRSLRKRIYRPHLQRKYAEQWTPSSQSGDFVQRQYSSYDDYVHHQQAKLKIHDLESYDVRFRDALRDRLKQAGLDWQGRSVLCLAARIGTEVRAFLDLGAFAVGLDLNPGKENRYVVQGDFHDIQFAAGSVDVVFTNSLDHAFDIERIAQGMHRVLKPEGVLIVEAVSGKEEGGKPGFFESFYWSSIDQLIGRLERSRFQLVSRRPFTYPWTGEHLWLRK